MNFLGFKSLIEWWASLDWISRIIIPVGIIVISTLMLLTGRVWIFGWILGIILLLFGGRSNSEKNGYRF